MEFTLRETLSSYEINVELLLRIERFIFEDLPGLIKVNASEIKKNYNLEITEKIGTEKIKSIANYRDPEFPDDTREILISTEVTAKNFSLRILFINEEEEKPKINVIFEGKNARETAITISNTIKRILKPNKTMNKYYHEPKYFVIPFILLIVGFIISAGFFLVNESFIQFFFGTFSSFLIFGLYAVGRKFNPYITFDSRLSRLYKKIYYFFFSGIIGFFVFEVLFGFLYGI